jgi:hypothetical protein
MRIKSWVTVIAAICCAACSGSPRVTGGDPVATSLADHSNGAATSQSAVCHAVAFNVAPSPVQPGIQEGAVTGDLEGTVRVVFDLATVEFHGVTISNAGTAHWTITGGDVPGLTTFDTEFENKNLAIDRPGSPATLFENIGRHRGTSGVEIANLTYQGTFDAVTRRGDHDYRGVICP